MPSSDSDKSVKLENEQDNILLSFTSDVQSFDTLSISLIMISSIPLASVVKFKMTFWLPGLI